MQVESQRPAKKRATRQPAPTSTWMEVTTMKKIIVRKNSHYLGTLLG